MAACALNDYIFMFNCNSASNIEIWKGRINKADFIRKQMERIALFPGSFNPFTKGHANIVNRALTLFDKVIIGKYNI